MRFASIIVAVAASILGFANAQNSSYAYAVDPGTVPIATRIGWCSSQRSSCTSICANDAPTNNCDPTSLNYSCSCGSGVSPNITQYNTTVPYFECQQYIINCVGANTMNATAQHACNAIQCGGKDPSMAAVSSTSSSSMSTMSATSSPTSAATSAASSSSSTHSGAAGHMTQLDNTFGTLMIILASGALLGGLAL